MMIYCAGVNQRYHTIHWEFLFLFFSLGVFKFSCCSDSEDDYILCLSVQKHIGQEHSFLGG